MTDAYNFNNVEPPFSNISPEYINKFGTTYAGNFGSNDTSAQFGNHGIVSNIKAAAASAIIGGSKTKKRKIKSIINKYKQMSRKTMSKSRRRGIRSSTKRKLVALLSRKDKNRHHKSRKGSRKHHKKTRRRHHKQRGGYHQYMGDVPDTPSYSTGGPLAPADSALANPVPYDKLTNLTNCVDNYNHYTNKGFQVWN
jgi:hypothetical protein